MRLQFIPRTGPFRGRIVSTDRNGQGVFTESQRTWTRVQHVGTSQTPTFTNVRQFAAWVRRHFDYSPPIED